MTTRLPLVYCYAMFLLATASAREIRIVALTGDQAPGADASVVFDGFGDLGRYRPVINASGQIAFYSFLTGTGVDSSNDFGVYSEGSGTLAEVARTGGQAPGADPGVLFTNFAVPVLNASGQTAFLGILSGPGVDSSNIFGIYSEGSGTLAEVARAGAQAPGADPGVLFRNFAVPVLNSSGQTAFTGSLTGPGVDSSNNFGIYSEGSGTLAEVAREGEQAPGADPGVLFRSFDDPALSASGQTAFLGSLIGAGVDSSNNFGIYSEGSGTLAEVARTGGQAPGADPGVLFSGFDFGSPALNVSGQTAFRGTLSGPGVDSSNNFGIYSEGSGTLAEVARAGDQAPGADPGVLFSSFAAPVLNSSGQTAFFGDLTGTGVDFTNHVGVYSEGSGTLAEVARRGGQAPGADQGVLFNNFADLVLNASGQIAFRGFLTGTGVDFANRTGIYASDRSGRLVEIARTGDLYDVNDDPLVEDLRTVASLWFTGGTGNGGGRGSGFNDRGQLVFSAVFTDGSHGILVSNLVAVPEPGSLAIVTLCGAGSLARRRR